MTTFLLVLTAILILGCAAWLTWYFRRKSRFIVATLNSNAEDLANRIWTRRTLDAHVDPRIILPTPGPWTLDGPAIATLCNVLRAERPSHVVELGSGLSTIVIASILKETGGRLTSIDHDEKFAEITGSFLEANDLSSLVDLRTASLTPLEKTANELWYDTRLLDDLRKIDLLVVDGPPKPVSPTIRRHALPYLHERLSPQAFILLDDAEREGEKSILEEWQRDFPIVSMQIVGYPKAHALMKFVR